MKLDTSPYNTRQEEYREDPWKMLMVCFMLNQTSHKQVDQVRHDFFNRFPNAQTLCEAEESEIAGYIKTLGFYNRRAKSWKQFSCQWIDLSNRYPKGEFPIEEIAKLKGVGKYALDSWKVFQLFEYDTQVEDHVLNWYVVWAREEKQRLLIQDKPFVPTVVYYLHYQDERFMEPNYQNLKDYACCVMARNAREAIDKTKEIAQSVPGALHVKIMGVATGNQDWVDEKNPLYTNEQEYKARMKQMRLTL
jgi:hypothetical protein